MSKPKPESWTAIIECTVKKSVVLEGCTELQAEWDPWKYATKETEIDMSDWTVLKVEPNE